MPHDLAHALEVHFALVRGALLAILHADAAHCGYTAWRADLERAITGPLAVAQAAAVADAQQLQALLAQATAEVQRLQAQTPSPQPHQEQLQ